MSGDKLKLIIINIITAAAAVTIIFKKLEEVKLNLT